jgi:hypothetical protein
MRSLRRLGKFAWLAGGLALVEVNDIRPPARELDSAHLAEVGTYPSGREYNWTDNLQGIASDGTWWYISANNNRARGPRNTAKLYRAAPQSIGRDIGPSIKPLSHAGLEGCSHIGDVDYHADAIYVAIDGCRDGNAKVGVFRRETLAYQGAFDLPGLSRAGGVAFNPKDGRLYALNRTLDGLRLYDVTGSGSAFRADFAREIPLLDQRGKRLRGNRNQGLKFSARGRVYIVFDHIDFAKAGVYGFAVGPRAARLSMFVPVRHGCAGALTCNKSGGVYLGDELEGLLIERIAEGPYKGDLHVLMIDNDVGKDDVYFRHYTAQDPEGP